MTATITDLMERLKKVKWQVLLLQNY